MSMMKLSNNGLRRRGRMSSVNSIMVKTRFLAGGALALMASPMLMKPANAYTINLGDYTITLQSTLGYNVGERTAPVDNAVATLNNDDGDRNFRSGLIQNRFSTLEQLGIADGDYGFRASAQAFIDTVYLQDSKNNSPNTFNAYGIGPKGFPSGTIANDGRKLNVLAAFIYGAENFDDGEQRLTWQIGRQTITWGETLYTFDGIAGLQSPADFYQAESEANPQAQNLFLPTGAASLSYLLADGVTLDGYWQFEYEPDILPGIGSYFGTNDYVGPGGQRILGSLINQGAFSLYRAPDIRPPNGLDQFGFAAHQSFGNYELGVYFVRGIPKSPAVYTNAPSGFVPGPSGFEVGQYNLVYAQPVNAYAVTASTLFLGANVAGELSLRTNQPLLSEPSYTAADPAKYSDPLYATGDVVNGTLSAIYLTPPMLGPVMANGASLTGEFVVNNVVSVTARQHLLVPGDTNIGGSFEGTFAPNWFPRPDTEIEFPVGWTTVFLGDSRFDGSAAGTSTYDIGLKAIYKSNLTLGVNYQRYAGPPDRQSNIDRDYATFYINQTF